VGLVKNSDELAWGSGVETYWGAVFVPSAEGWTNSLDMKSGKSVIKGKSSQQNEALNTPKE
jgi:hypothetical protein